MRIHAGTGSHDAGTRSHVTWAEQNHVITCQVRGRPLPVGYHLGRIIGVKGSSLSFKILVQTKGATVNLEQAGYTIIPGVIASHECKVMAGHVQAALHRDDQSAIDGVGRNRKSKAVVGGRNLLSLWRDWGQVTEDPRVKELVLEHVGDQAGLVRGLYFDKPPGHGWALAMHRDMTIAVAEHREVASTFSKPTTKGGVPHVEASIELLKMMLTLRIHLDPMVEENGPLDVIPGSHIQLDSCSTESLCPIYCQAGDVFVMRPLLIHGSRACDPKTTLHRRVIHLEIAPTRHLPSGYQWHQFKPLF